MTAPIFKPKLFQFLEDLRDNNNRDWFNEHKPAYESGVRAPAVELVQRLKKPLARSAPMLSAVAKGHGGSVMRIYRDTRFSKDKAPYKTNLGISLRHQADKDIHAPGLYIHFAPEECFVGAGCWRPERKTLAAIRTAIDQQPKVWNRVKTNKAFAQSYELAGESLKTSPRDYDKGHPMIDDLRRIDFIGVSPLTRQEVLAGDLIELLMDRIKKAKPLMRFLCEAIGVPY